MPVTIKHPEPSTCHGCGQRLPTFNRFTLPRAITGDLVFCGYRCSEAWRARQDAR
jgi:hypothetical protein